MAKQDLGRVENIRKGRESKERESAEDRVNRIDVLKERAEKAALGKPSKVKCIASFNCNHVVGTSGQFLTEDELKIIGQENGKKLHAAGCLEIPGKASIAPGVQVISGGPKDSVPDNIELVE